MRDDDRACGSAERGPDATIGRKGDPSLPSSRSAFSRIPATSSSVNPAADLGNRPGQSVVAIRAASRIDCHLISSSFARAASRRGRLRRATAIARRHSRALEVAMQDMRRLEADDFDRSELREVLPEPRPETRRLDAMCATVSDFVCDLRLVAEVGDETNLRLRCESSALEPENPVR